jgi:hypothetical protein
LDVTKVIESGTLVQTVIVMPNKTPPVRVEPRVKRTRRLLRDALVSLILEKDFASITIKEITERAEVALCWLLGSSVRICEVKRAEGGVSCYITLISQPNWE